MNRGWPVGLRVLLLLIVLAMLPLAAESPAAGLELKQVQQHLQAMGYEPGPHDGVMGPRTHDALTAFQMDSGMTVSGQLDEATQNALRVRIEALERKLAQLHDKSDGPPGLPMLRLDTDMHTAPIKRVASDRGGRWLVTASDDKTLRLWSLDDGTPVRTLRVPVGIGNAGRLFAVAMDPDGDWIAAGGWTRYPKYEGHSLYLFDRATGGVSRRIGGLPDMVTSLCVSRDGRFLAAGLYGGAGLRVWSTTDWQQVAEDSGYGGGSYRCDFGPDGHLITSADDGYLRLYGDGFGHATKIRAPGGDEPFSAVFSPDGRSIAVGYADSTRLDLLSAEELTHQYSPDTGGIDNGNLARVAWSRDGRRLYAGGRFEGEHHINPVVTWDAAGRGERRFWRGAENTITDLCALPGGRLAVGMADPAWLVLGGDGRELLGRRASIADLRGKRGMSFTLSGDGSRVRFGLEYGDEQPVLFDLKTRTLLSGAKPDADLSPPLISAPGIKLKGWKNAMKPKLNGRSLSLGSHERSRSVALALDGSGLVLGADWSLRRFDVKGKEVWSRPVTGTVWGVNISSDGRLVVTAQADGTIRWYRYRDGEELLALFPHIDGKRWVAWTPSGYYDASPGADDLIGWHLNNGMNKAADFYPVGLLRDYFYRPEVVEAILEKGDETLALERAGEKKVKPVTDALPPLVELLSLEDGDSFDSAGLVLRYRLRSRGGEPVTGIRILVDGCLLGTREPPALSAEGMGEVSVTLPSRDLELGLVAENRHGAGEPAAVKLIWAGQRESDPPTKPNLYVLSVGVSDYSDPSMRLDFAAKDARDFAGVLEKQAGGLYREVETRVLEDEGADEGALLEGFKWLQEQVTARDVSVIFLAGHGVNDREGNYWFLPKDADPEQLGRTAVAYDAIKEAIASLPGRTIAFIDTGRQAEDLGGEVRGGVADINALVNDLAAPENGVIVFASSTGRQSSVEDEQWGNGAFTKALLEALSGKLSLAGEGTVTIEQLGQYLVERVKDLTGNQQTPVTDKPPMMPDFPFAVIEQPDLTGSGEGQPRPSGTGQAPQDYDDDVGQSGQSGQSDQEGGDCGHASCDADGGA